MAAAGSKRKRAASSGLADLHDDMLEGVLARLPPAAYSRLRGVSRRWRAAADSATFRAACARVADRDPWFLMLQEDADQRRRPAVVFDSAGRRWARWRGAPGSVPVAAAGGLVLYRDPATGDLTVANPLTGASRALPPPPASYAGAGALQAVAMYGAPYRVVLITGELPDLSTVTFDSATGAWGEAAALARKPEEETAGAAAAGRERAAAEDGEGDDTVYFLSKSGDVVATTMQRSAARLYSSAVACGGNGEEEAAVAYFLSRSGAVVACDLARRAFAELPRVLPAYHEYSIDVVACGGAAYAVVLSEFLDAPSLRVWEPAPSGAWRQVAAMPPAMAHAFRGAKADVNCVGHGHRLMVCVSSGDPGASGCFLCDVRTNRWEELPPRADDGDLVAALSFEPRMEAAV
ncbi:hypothetical protein U9M48_015882 [Paspalum notatum var. saurae]|uniref:F-box domain-containing protein n=1 Tax=Paspalum notatum var. saurae TaxID=547442 RepID=A0AAQ3T4X5_PASNO